MPFLGATAFVIFGNAVTWGTVITYAIAAVSAYESMRRAKSMRRRAIEEYNASLEDRLVMTSTASGARSRVYGRVRNVDGVLFKGTWGEFSENYLFVIALAGHEIDGIETIYFNDVPVELQADGFPLVDGTMGYWVVTPPILQSPVLGGGASITVSGGVGSVELEHTPIAGSLVAGQDLGGDNGEQLVTPTVVGNVVTLSDATDGEWWVSYQYVAFHPRARIWKYLGSPTQDLSQIVVSRFPSLATTADKFRGVAALVVEMQYDENAYPDSVPNITAVIRGAKVLDPRTLLTAWSQNPALIARDWALHPNGGQCSESEIVESAFVAAANACDVETEFDTVDGPETRPLYECGITCKLDDRPDEGLDEIVESMAGKWGWAGGRLTTVAGVYRAPVADITESWVSDVEEIVIVKDAPRSEVVNIYRATIANADGYVDGVTGDIKATAYSVAQAPEVRSDAFITADGQELVREISLGGVTRTVHAQHVCGVFMREARDALTLKLPCNLRAFVLEMFDVVTVTLPRFGFAAKEFEILGWEFSAQGGVLLTLKETAASIYDPDSGLDVLDAAPNTSLPSPWNVGYITGLAADSGTSQLLLQQDGTIVTRVLVSWDSVAVASVLVSGRVEIRWGIAGTEESTWQTVVAPGADVSLYLTGVPDGRYILIKARAASTIVRGEWCTQIAHLVVGKTEPPPPIDRFKLIQQPSGVRQFFWDYENPPVDLFAFEGRYSLGTDLLPWDDMIPLFAKDRQARQHETTDPQNDGSYVFAICAVDSTGNRSTPTYIDGVLDGDTFGAVDLIVLPHEERWPGTKTNCHVSGSELANDGTSTWNDFDVDWGATEELWANTASSPIVYEHPPVDRLTVADRSIRVSQLVSGIVTVEMATSDDGITYSAWAAVPGPAVTSRFHKFRWTVSGANPRIFRAQVIFYV